MAGRQSSLKSVFLLSAGSFGHLVLQFVLLKILADLYGTGEQKAAYSAARAVPLVISTILIGTLSFAFVPIFVERRERLGRRAAWETAGSVVGLMLLVTTSFAILASLAAQPLIARLNPNFSGEQLKLTVGLFRIVVWLTVTNGMIGVLQALHQCHHRFLLPALSPILGSGIAVLSTWLLHEKLGIAATAYGVLIGAILGAAIQLPLFLRHARIRIGGDAGLSRILHMMAPLVAGAAYYKLDPLVDRYLLQPTSIPLLDYSWAITSAMLILTSSGLSVVVFPVIAQHSSSGNRAGLKDELAYAMRFLAFVLTPVVVGLLFFSTPVIKDLFQGGEFTPADTEMVSQLVKIYTLVMIAGSFGEMLSRVFYVLNDTWTPVRISVVGFTLGAIAKYLVAPQWGVIGVVSATSTYYLFNAASMLWLLRKRIQGVGFGGVLRMVRDSLFGAAVAAAVAYCVIQLGFRLSSIVAALLAAVAYGGVMYVIRNEFAVMFVSYLAGFRDRIRQNGDHSDADQ
ncbi:MurJ-like flippase [Symmachiella macrocystis]|uniref:MurJ-like flippase n=1 Tax=Symmachiella macrocystis TaxID=2527985 RepID=A0A5C6BBB0_9PLAN|nr:MurJ-like flippase [Symmachiella macrocystis]